MSVAARAVSLTSWGSPVSVSCTRCLADIAGHGEGPVLASHEVQDQRRPRDGVRPIQCDRRADGVTLEGVLADGVTQDGVLADGVTLYGVLADGVILDSVLADGVTLDNVLADRVTIHGVRMTLHGVSFSGRCDSRRCFSGRCDTRRCF